MRVTSQMFKDNPDLTAKEIIEKITNERHKSDKRMPNREERRTENEIKQLEKK